MKGVIGVVDVTGELTKQGIDTGAAGVVAVAKSAWAALERASKNSSYAENVTNLVMHALTRATELDGALSHYLTATEESLDRLAGRAGKDLLKAWRADENKHRRGFRAKALRLVRRREPVSFAMVTTAQFLKLVRTAVATSLSSEAWEATAPDERETSLDHIAARTHEEIHGARRPSTMAYETFITSLRDGLDANDALEEARRRRREGTPAATGIGVAGVAAAGTTALGLGSPDGSGLDAHDLWLAGTVATLVVVLVLAAVLVGRRRASRALTTERARASAPATAAERALAWECVDDWVAAVQAATSTTPFELTARLKAPPGAELAETAPDLVARVLSREEMLAIARIVHLTQLWPTLEKEGRAQRLTDAVRRLEAPQDTGPNGSRVAGPFSSSREPDARQEVP